MFLIAFIEFVGCGLNFKNRSSVYAHLKKRHHNKDVSITPAVYDSWPVTLVSAEHCNLMKESVQTHTSGELLQHIFKIRIVNLLVYVIFLKCNTDTQFCA